jgi:hypothetical protein
MAGSSHPAKEIGRPVAGRPGFGLALRQLGDASGDVSGDVLSLGIVLGTTRLCDAPGVVLGVVVPPAFMLLSNHHATRAISAMAISHTHHGVPLRVTRTSSFR